MLPVVMQKFSHFFTSADGCLKKGSRRSDKRLTGVIPVKCRLICSDSLINTHFPDFFLYFVILVKRLDTEDKFDLHLLHIGHDFRDNRIVDFVFFIGHR